MYIRVCVDQAVGSCPSDKKRSNNQIDRAAIEGVLKMGIFNWHPHTSTFTQRTIRCLHSKFRSKYLSFLKILLKCHILKLPFHYFKNMYKVWILKSINTLRYFKLHLIHHLKNVLNKVPILKFYNLFLRCHIY